VTGEVEGGLLLASLQIQVARSDRQVFSGGCAGGDDLAARRDDDRVADLL
jgi:hypothetical protein